MAHGRRGLRSPLRSRPVTPGGSSGQEPGFWERTWKSMTLPAALGLVGTLVAIAGGGYSLWRNVWGEPIRRCEAVRAALVDPAKGLQNVTGPFADSVLSCAQGSRAQSLFVAVTEMVRSKAPYTPGSPCTSAGPNAPRDSVIASAGLQRAIGLLGRLAKRAGSPVELQRTDLRHAAFGPDTIDLVNLDGSCLAGARFHRTQLEGSSFRHAVLSEATFSEVRLAGAVFDSASGDWAAFTESTLHGARFTGARLPNVRFVESDLSCTTFDGNVVLDGADFSSARLPWSYLRGASLRNVRFWRSIPDSGLQNTLLVEQRGLPPDVVQWSATRGAVVGPQPEDWLDRRALQCPDRAQR